MKTCRKPVAMVLLLLIHLLTLQIGDAGRNRPNVSNAKSDPKIIVEEVIIAGSGNSTRVIANAVAEGAPRLDGEILSLLSKREKRGSRRSEQTPSNWDQDDQDAAQSRVNLDEEADLEMLNRVIAKYEPQRITMRKTKRKIVDGPNGTHDIQDKVAGSITDLERAYAKVLRNISRNALGLTENNPYLSQAMRQLKQIYIPETTIRSVTDDGAQKSRSDIDSSFASPILKSKKSKKLIKKYSQLNRIATTPRFSPVEESKHNEETAGSNESSTPVGYFKVPNGKTEPKNGSLSVPNVYFERPKSHREWNVQNSSVQAPPPFNSPLENSNANSIINANNLKNVPSDVNAVQLPPRYNVVPRPFSISQSPNLPVTASIEVSYRKPSLPPAGFGHQQQVAPSSANVLPLVLPTDLFNPLPTRRYVPIKRANRLNLEGNSATILSTEASRATSPVGKKTTLADYGALYTDVIGTTSSPLVTVNSQQSYVSSDYYPITESPVEQTVTATNFATTYIPSQTSASYTVQRQKDSQVVPNKNEFLPRITTYSSPDDEKSSLNENPGIALYNKFANLYSVNVPNVFNAPKAVTQNYKQPVQPSQHQISALPYVTLKPLTPTLPKARPIVPSKPLAPYYDSKLLVSPDVDGKNKNSEENVKTNKQFRAKDADETEKEDDDIGNFENYNNQTNREAYKAYKTPNKQHKKEDREEEEEEDRYPQQSRNYGYQDKHDKDDRSSRNDDRPEKYENVRHEDNDDEEEVDETEEEEYVSIGKNKDEDNNDRRRQYNKYEYDRDNSEEEERDKLHYDRKKYNKPKDRHDKHDYGSDDEHRFENSNKYYKSLFNDDETREYDKEYRDRSDKKKLADDNQYKKSRQDRRYQESEDESVAEDKPFAQHSKNQHAYRQDEKYGKEQNNDNDKRKYHRASPRRDSLREEHKREEYGESNPKHIREEYHQRVKDDHHGHHRHDSETQDDGKGEARDHVHGETQEHAHKHEEHHEKKKGGGDHKFEEGGGGEHEEEHHGHKGEKGEKGYKVWHENEKAEKGHHDKEHASKHYDEKDGKEKKHEEEGGYHEDHHHGEEGKKTAEFGEKGEHKKGHSTHGEHSVHKKDEYEKKTEFFDEFNEDGGMEKHGEHHHDHESKKSGHEKKSHHDGADHEEKYGKEKKHENGGHHHEHKGHKVDEGHDHHYDHDHKYGKKEGHEHGKKWSFKKGDGGGDAGGDHKHNR